MPPIVIAVLCLFLAIGASIALYIQSKRSNLVARDAQYSLREIWLRNLRVLSFANEAEVEVKFVYPLLLHLGYRDEDLSARYKVPIHVGRELLHKEADWVIWKKVGNTTRAVFIVEAKSPVQSLNGNVQAQARSYAFYMNAPRYVLTNGIDFKVFELK